MAVTFNGTSNELPSGKVPTGFTDPTVTKVTVTGDTYISTHSIEIAKATVENATKATTLANIFDDVAVGLDKQMGDICANDFNASATVEAHAEVIDLVSNQVPNATSDFLDDTATKYVATVKLYANAS